MTNAGGTIWTHLLVSTCDLNKYSSLLTKIRGSVLRKWWECLGPARSFVNLFFFSFCCLSGGPSCYVFTHRYINIYPPKNSLIPIFHFFLWNSDQLAWVVYMVYSKTLAASLSTKWKTSHTAHIFLCHCPHFYYWTFILRCLYVYLQFFRSMEKSCILFIEFCLMATFHEIIVQYQK